MAAIIKPKRKVVEAKKGSGLTVVTPPAIANYAFVWKARPPMKGSSSTDPSYSITLIFPKGTNMDGLKAAAKLAAQTKWPEGLPKKLINPFHDGNKEGPEDKQYDKLYKNTIFINARSTSKPGIVDKDLQPILDETEFYSGCKCRASVYAFAYNYEGMKKGVSFLLNNIQKISDGERIGGGKSSPEEDFGDDLDDDDDEEEEETDLFD